MNPIKKVFTLFCAAVLLSGALSLGASADDANVTYTGNSGDLIFEPGSEHSPTDLFADFKNVMPGASLTQKITVTNRADKQVKVKLYLRSLGSADESYNDFLNQLTLSVSKETETPMFDAAADQTAGLTDWVCLGTLYSGGSLDLNVTLSVPTSLDNRYQKQIGKIKWQFVAEEFPITESSWVCPSGEKHRYHIEEIGGSAFYICDDCEQTEPIECEVCGGKMREVIVISVRNNLYYTYLEGKNHTKTEDDRVHFYFNDEGIIEYYTVDGERIDIHNVNEYTLFEYLECLKNKEHHTDPHSPQTGDTSHHEIWLILLIVSSSLMIILLLFLRRKKNEDEKARAKC